MHLIWVCRNCLWSWNCSFCIMTPPHSISSPYFCFMHNFIFLMLSWSAGLCNRRPSGILEGCASAERKTMSWIAGGLARVPACQLPASPQRGADDIPSDKSVKGEESTIAPPSKKGKVKANERDSGHGGAETMWNRSVKDKAAEEKPREVRALQPRQLLTSPSLSFSNNLEIFAHFFFGRQEIRVNVLVSLICSFIYLFI